MPDVYTWIAWAVAGLAFVLGAEVFGIAGLVPLIAVALLALTVVAATAGARARRTLAKPDPRFEATAEVFRDPSTGTVTRVYVNHSTGERRYRRGS
jgi:hypothetical protein